MMGGKGRHRPSRRSGRRPARPVRGSRPPVAPRPGPGWGVAGSGVVFALVGWLLPAPGATLLAGAVGAALVGWAVVIAVDGVTDRCAWRADRTVERRNRQAHRGEEPPRALRRLDQR